MARRALFIFGLVCWSLHGFGQTEYVGFQVKIKGFLIDFAGLLVFQPSEETTGDSIWNFIDDRSFILSKNKWDDLVFPSVKGITDYFDVYRLDSATGVKTIYSIGYFRCELDIIIFPIDKKGVAKFTRPSPAITFCHGNQLYRLCSISMPNRVISIVPENPELLRKMKNFYLRNGYDLPPELSESNN